ncbi:MAG TPA: hypothetical protein VMR98_02070 [Candidatus Polarisedimenticolaceae bacterium]|nr:hypothetical protein [Candidatus Polarisedimenticolaceae bacterium]
MATKAKPAKAKEISTNNFIALVVVGSVLIVLAAGYFSFHLIKENFRNGQVIAGKLTAKSDLKQKLDDANTLVDNYNALSPQNQQLVDSALPISPDFPQIISLIESAANVSGVNVKAVSAEQAANLANADASNGAPTVPNQKAPPGNTPQPFAFSATIEGPYDRITQFFKNLELSARPMKVTAFELKGNSGSLVGTLTVQTYYQGEADIADKKEVVK